MKVFLKLKVCFFLIVIFSFSLFASNEKTTDSAIVEKLKSAVFFVKAADIRGYSYSGSAFLISPDGYILTNAHIIKSRKKVYVYRFSGTEKQEEYSARLITADKEKDFALLKIEAPEPFKDYFTISKEVKFSETDDIIAGGFPLGNLISGSAPVMTISTGKITSITREKDVVQRIQTDASLTIGNSGSPLVLESTGEVIGIVTSGISFSRIAFCEPYNKINNFLNRRDIKIEIPEIALDDPFNKHDITVKIISYLGQAISGDLTLFVADASGTRAVKTSATSEVKIPVSLLEDRAAPSSEIRGKILFSKGDFAYGFLETRTIPAWPADPGFTGNYLHSIKRDGANLIFVNVYGNALSIPMDEDAVINIKISGMPLPVPIENFDVFECDLGLTETKSDILAVLNDDSGEEIARAFKTVNVPLKDLSDIPAFIPSEFESVYPKIEITEQKQYTLPYTFSKVIPAMGGRRLLFDFHGESAIGVFDIEEGRIVNMIRPGTSEYTFSAAGDRLIIIDKARKFIHTWDIRALEKLSTKMLPVAEIVRDIYMGYDNPDIFVLHLATGTGSLDDCYYRLYDNSFKKLAEDKNPRRGGSFRDNIFAMISPNGRYLGIMERFTSPSGVFVYSLSDEAMKSYYEHDSEGTLFPDNNGFYYSASGKIYNEQLRMLKEYKNRPLYPSQSGHFYLALQETAADLYIASSHIIAARLPYKFENLYEADSHYFYNRNTNLPVSSRVFMLDKVGIIVMFPMTNTEVAVIPFDIDALLKDAEIDYLFTIASQPPPALKGKLWKHKINVKSSSSVTDIVLSDGPAGMTITRSGEIVWMVPDNYAEGGVNVLINIRNQKGEEYYEKFSITVKK